MLIQPKEIERLPRRQGGRDLDRQPGRAALGAAADGPQRSPRRRAPLGRHRHLLRDAGARQRALRQRDDRPHLRDRRAGGHRGRRADPRLRPRLAGGAEADAQPDQARVRDAVPRRLQAPAPARRSSPSRSASIPTGSSRAATALPLEIDELGRPASARSAGRDDLRRRRRHRRPRRRRAARPARRSPPTACSSSSPRSRRRTARRSRRRRSCSAASRSSTRRTGWSTSCATSSSDSLADAARHEEREPTPAPGGPPRRRRRVRLRAAAPAPDGAAGGGRGLSVRASPGRRAGWLGTPGFAALLTRWPWQRRPPQRPRRRAYRTERACRARRRRRTVAVGAARRGSRAGATVYRYHAARRWPARCSGRGGRKTTPRCAAEARRRLHASPRSILRRRRASAASARSTSPRGESECPGSGRGVSAELAIEPGGGGTLVWHVARPGRPAPRRLRGPGRRRQRAGAQPAQPAGEPPDGPRASSTTRIPSSSTMAPRDCAGTTTTATRPC